MITTFSVCGKTKSIADAHRNFVKQTGKNLSRSSFRERISNKTLLDFIEKAVLKFSFHIQEKALSAIIEFSVEDSRLKDALTALKDVSSKIDTVFSLCLINRVGEGGTIANLTAAREAGFTPSLNTKTNVGFGQTTEGGELI